MRIKLKDIKNKILYKRLKIREVKYEWAQPLNYNFKPNMIVYHHTSEDNLTPEKIDKMHKKRGWAGIGYHFYIRKDGKIYGGRPENTVGAHASDVNDRAFGIALEGNFNYEQVSSKQKKSLIALSRYLIRRYNITDLKRHRDVKNTECPGENFPFKEIKEKLIPLKQTTRKI